MYDYTVDMLHRQSQIRGFVLLQLHIHIAQSSAYERLMVINGHGQRCLCPLAGEYRLPEEVLQVSCHNPFLYREAIGERRNLTKQFPLHIACLLLVFWCKYTLFLPNYMHSHLCLCGQLPNHYHYQLVEQLVKSVQHPVGLAPAVRQIRAADGYSRL